MRDKDSDFYHSITSHGHQRYMFAYLLLLYEGVVNKRSVPLHVTDGRVGPGRSLCREVRAFVTDSLARYRDREAMLIGYRFVTLISSIKVSPNDYSKKLTPACLDLTSRLPHSCPNSPRGLCMSATSYSMDLASTCSSSSRYIFAISFHHGLKSRWRSKSQ